MLVRKRWAIPPNRKLVAPIAATQKPLFCEHKPACRQLVIVAGRRALRKRKNPFCGCNILSDLRQQLARQQQLFFFTLIRSSGGAPCAYIYKIISMRIFPLSVVLAAAGLWVGKRCSRRTRCLLQENGTAITIKWRAEPTAAFCEWVRLMT